MSSLIVMVLNCSSDTKTTLSQRPHPPPPEEISSENIESLSEQHIDSIIVRLKGGQHSFECPVCLRQLHSHETEYSAQLHVEQCLLDNEKNTT